uniref:Uncharacterized protein n=1 Tax=Cacopsylla melanoneura TaxID=428564 RepID=A0A8D8Z0T5_9HEMI
MIYWINHLVLVRDIMCCDLTQTLLKEWSPSHWSTIPPLWPFKDPPPLNTPTLAYPTPPFLQPSVFPSNECGRVPDVHSHITRSGRSRVIFVTVPGPRPV